MFPPRTDTLMGSTSSPLSMFLNILMGRLFTCVRQKRGALPQGTVPLRVKKPDRVPGFDFAQVSLRLSNQEVPDNVVQALANKGLQSCDTHAVTNAREPKLIRIPPSSSNVSSA